MPESLWPDPLPRPCHWISRPDEAKLREPLLSCGMAEVIDADAVPRDQHGRRIVAGLLSVPRKAESDT
eukprot:8706565-Heterocapsa_arctica.AAC.1